MLQQPCIRQVRPVNPQDDYSCADDFENGPVIAEQQTAASGAKEFVHTCAQSGASLAIFAHLSVKWKMLAFNDILFHKPSPLVV
jgi:hypothetical protein